ncbi:MAG: hypothetical protein B6A08_16380 [Sorangiineae bacterium NIC37A_2]|jgi:CRP-like cAMP-binding protein|nr:MAG: hypothetical protein B6A08_16380 [Sorangiineae bacterium NIC37A_2]
MSFSSVSIPPPSPEDPEDVVWALQAAKAQWSADSWRDAVKWVERAAEAAEELGKIHRSVELLQLVASMTRAAEEATASETPITLPIITSRSSRSPSVSVPPLPPLGRGRMPSPLEIDAELDEVPELEVAEASIDFEELEEIVEDDELLEEDEDEVVLDVADATEVVEYDSRAYQEEPSAAYASPDDELPNFDSDDRETNRLPPPPAPNDTIRTQEDTVETSANFDFAEERQTSPELDAGPWIDPLSPAFGDEVDFEDEAPTFVREHGSRPPPAMPAPSPVSSGPPPESLGPPESAPVDIRSAIDRREPAVFAAVHDPGPPSDEPNEIERELGVDLSLRLYPQISSTPSAGPTSKKPDSLAAPPGGEPEPIPTAPPPDVRSSAPPFEPFPTAPSASLPPTRPIEPPSKPFHAPPPDSMREPELHFENYDYPDETEGPPGAVISAPPARPIEMPPPTSRRSTSPSRPSDPADSLFPVGLTDTTIDGIHLLEVPGLGEFSKDALTMLLTTARKVKLSPGEEVNSFAAALVTRGTVHLMPTIADASCAAVRKGGVIFTQGSLEAGIDLRVVGFDLGTRVVVFDREPFNQALAMCPWVAEELSAAADNYQALAGAVMGPLGESFDEMFRSMVLDKLAVKHVRSGETIVQAGKPLDGIYVVGAGSLIAELANGETRELGPGDFVFADTLLSASPAPGTVRARENSLVLYAGRMVAQELFATCPPFIELLASA